MWPWGHAAVGYLAYSLGYRASDRRLTGAAVIALGVGTQFPDLIDKPLGWTFGVLPGGRTLAHSLLTVAVVAVVLGALTRRVRCEGIAVAFLVGYLSHTLSDGLYALLEGNYADLSYLLWPVLPAPEPEIGRSFLAHFAGLSVDPYFAFEITLLVLATALWNADGRPGIGYLRERLGAVRTAVATAIR
mgnify:CR=1 FL=1